MWRFTLIYTLPIVSPSYDLCTKVNAGSPLMKLSWWMSLFNSHTYVEATVKTLHWVQRLPSRGDKWSMCVKHWKPNVHKQGHSDVTSEAVQVNILHQPPCTLYRPNFWNHVVTRKVWNSAQSRRYVPWSEAPNQKLWSGGASCSYEVIIMLTLIGYPLILEIVGVDATTIACLRDDIIRPGCNLTNLLQSQSRPVAWRRHRVIAPPPEGHKWSFVDHHDWMQICHCRAEGCGHTQLSHQLSEINKQTHDCMIDATKVESQNWPLDMPWWVHLASYDVSQIQQTADSNWQAISPLIGNASYDYAVSVSCSFASTSPALTNTRAIAQLWVLRERKPSSNDARATAQLQSYTLTEAFPKTTWWPVTTNSLRFIIPFPGSPWYQRSPNYMTRIHTHGWRCINQPTLREPM